mgnify:CR=1 FL=1
MNKITEVRKHSLDLCIKSMLDLEPDLDIDLAESFVKYLTMNDQCVQGYRITEILLRSGSWTNLLQQWLLNTDLPITASIKDELVDRYHTAKLTYTVYRFDSPSTDRKYQSYVLDASSYFKSFVVINTLCSSVKGEGSKLLDRLNKVFPDSIILGEVGCLLACDYDLFKEGLISDPVDALIKYYTRNGFVSINDKIGHYEESHIVAKFNGHYEMYSRAHGSVLLL